MKWIVILAACALASFCAKAQETPGGKHRYLAMMDNHSIQQLTHPTQDELQSGMSLERLVEHKCEGFNKALFDNGIAEQIDDSTIRITDMYGETHDRPLMTADMLSDAEDAGYATLSECTAGRVYVSRWFKGGHEWYWRDQTSINGIPEKGLSIDVGEYYRIPSMIGVKVIYQMAGCGNAASMLKGYYKPKVKPFVPEPYDQPRDVCPDSMYEVLSGTLIITHLRTHCHDSIVNWRSACCNEQVAAPKEPECPPLHTEWQKKYKVKFANTTFFVWNLHTIANCTDSVYRSDTVIRIWERFRKWGLPIIGVVGIGYGADRLCAVYGIGIGHHKGDGTNNSNGTGGGGVIDSGTTNNHPTSGHRSSHKETPAQQGVSMITLSKLNPHQYMVYQRFGMPIKPIAQQPKPVSLYYTATIKMSFSDILRGNWTAVGNSMKFSFGVNSLMMKMGQ